MGLPIKQKCEKSAMENMILMWRQQKVKTYSEFVDD